MSCSLFIGFDAPHVSTYHNPNTALRAGNKLLRCWHIFESFSYMMGVTYRVAQDKGAAVCLIISVLFSA